MSGYGDIAYGLSPYGGSLDAAVPVTITGGLAVEGETALAGIGAAHTPYEQWIFDNAYSGAVWWSHFDETSGTTTADVSSFASFGLGHPGSLSNGVTTGASGLQRGPYARTAFSFDGVNDYVVTSGSPSITYSSLSAVALVDISGNASQTIIARGTTFILGVDSAGALTCSVTTAVTHTATAAAALTTGKHLVIATYKAGQLDLWDNGVHVAQLTWTETPRNLPNDNSNILVGANLDTGNAVVNYFSGTIDEPLLTTNQFNNAMAAALWDLVAGTTTVLGGTATETDSALTGGDAFTAIGGLAVEGETALAGGSNTSFPGGVAVEGETALAGSVRLGLSIVGGTALESDTATAGHASVGFGGGTAVEGDSALHGKSILTVIGRTAVEVDSVRPGSVQRLGGLSVRRWVLHDPSTSETWTFPINPNKMTSPHPTKTTTIFARNYNFEDTKAGVGRVLEYQQEPYDWQFSGVIRSQQHYTDFRDWCHRVHRLELTDHLGRTWRIRFDSVDLEEQKPTLRKDWRFSYTAKAIMYGRVS